MDRKTVADILFTTSVTVFLDQRNNGFIWILNENLNQVKDFNYSEGCPFFVLSLCVAILPNMNQSSEDIFLFESHNRDCYSRVSSQETSISLRFSCIDAIVEYIFDMFAKNLRIEPYEIQHVIIQQLSCEVKQSKIILRNLGSRSCEMKVCKAELVQKTDMLSVI